MGAVEEGVAAEGGLFFAVAVAALEGVVEGAFSNFDAVVNFGVARSRSSFSMLSQSLLLLAMLPSPSSPRRAGWCPSGGLAPGVGAVPGSRRNRSMLPAFGGFFGSGLCTVFLQLGPQGQWSGLHIWPLVWQRHPCALLPALVPNRLRMQVLVWLHSQHGFSICLLLEMFQTPASWVPLLLLLFGLVVFSDNLEVVASFDEVFPFFFL